MVARPSPGVQPSLWQHLEKSILFKLGYDGNQRTHATSASLCQGGLMRKSYAGFGVGVIAKVCQGDLMARRSG
jgi:hypothetical protein